MSTVALTPPRMPDSVKKRVPLPFDHSQVAIGYSFMTGLDRIGIVGGGSVYPAVQNLLLAAHAPECASVMARVCPADRLLLGGLPELCLVLLSVLFGIDGHDLHLGPG